MTASTLARLKARPRPFDTYTCAYDPADAKALADAARRVDDAKADGAKAAARRELKKLRESVVTIEFRLEGIGPAAWEALMAEHTPTDEQVERARTSAAASGEDPDKVTLQWNEESFPPAVLAASVTSVTISDAPDDAIDGLSVADATELWQSLSQGDQLGLFFAAQTLNLAPTRVEALGKG